MKGLKEFLDRHPNVIISFEIEPEGIDCDTPEYVIRGRLRDSSDDTPSVTIVGDVFSNLDECLNALFPAIKACYDLPD